MALGGAGLWGDNISAQEVNRRIDEALTVSTSPTATNIYGGLMNAGNFLSLEDGTSLNGVDTKAPNVMLSRFIDQDYDEGSGNEWDEGVLHGGVTKTSGDTYAACATHSVSHLGGEGQMVAAHNRAYAGHANASVYSTWSYVHGNNGSGVGHEININYDGTDYGWISGVGGAEYIGSITSTADSCSSPAQIASYYAAQKVASSVSGTGIAFVEGSPDTITAASGLSVLSGSPYIRVSGASAANNAILKVASITDTTITLDAGESITAESAGASVIIERWQNRGFWTGLHFAQDAIEKTDGSGNGEIGLFRGAKYSDYAYKGMRFYDGFFDRGIEFTGASFAKGAMELAKGQTINWGGTATTEGAFYLTVDGSDNFAFVGDGTSRLIVPYNNNSATDPQLIFGINTNGSADTNTGLSRTTGDTLNFISNGTNVVQMTDSAVSCNKPVRVEQYTVAGAPAASVGAGAVIYVTNGDAGSPCLAVSNGTDWLRVALGAAISSS